MAPKTIHVSKVPKSAKTVAEKKVSLGKLAAAFHKVGIDSKVAKGVLMGIAPAAAGAIAYHYKGKDYFAEYGKAKTGTPAQEVVKPIETKPVEAPKAAAAPAPAETNKTDAFFGTKKDD